MSWHFFIFFVLSTADAPMTASQRLVKVPRILTFRTSEYEAERVWGPTIWAFWCPICPILAMIMHLWLVVSNMNGLFSISYMGYIILPIDELHDFSRWLKHVKTTNQIMQALVWSVWKVVPAHPQAKWHAMTPLELGCKASFLSKKTPGIDWNLTRINRTFWGKINIDEIRLEYLRISCLGGWIATNLIRPILKHSPETTV